MLLLVFVGRPLVKRFALYRTVVCHVLSLSVTLVYCSQTVGWIKMPLGREVGIGPGRIVLGGDPDPPPRKKGHSTGPPLFDRCLLWPNGRPSQQLLSCCFKYRMGVSKCVYSGADNGSVGHGSVQYL